MIVQPGAAVGDVEAVVVGEVEEAVKAEDVDGGPASNPEPSLSFCMCAAVVVAVAVVVVVVVVAAVAVVAVAVVVVFCANYYGSHCLHSFLQPYPWHCRHQPH